MVGAGVLSKYQDAIGELKIIERDGSFANADGFTHGATARFVAHIGTIRQVVGAKLAHEKLIQKCGFVRSPARCIKDGFIGSWERVQFFGYNFKRFWPRHGAVMRCTLIKHHRMRQAPRSAQVAVAPCSQFFDGMRFEKCGRDALFGGFFGDSFRAVFAVLRA